MRMFLTMIAVAVFAGPMLAADTKVALTGENTKITFTGTKNGGKKAGDKHEGGFKTLKGAAVVEGDELKKIEVVIETDSLYADNNMLAGHLKSPDFFGVKNNPTAKFSTTKIEKGDKGYTLTGDLTLLGKTKSLTFPATVSFKDGTLKLTAEVTISQTDYGMTYGAGKLDDEVAIKVALEAK